MNGCISILLFGVVFLVTSVLLTALRFGISIWRTTRSFRRTMKDFARGESSGQQTADGKRSGNHADHSGQKSANSKIFSSNEGEYIDFEEVK